MIEQEDPLEEEPDFLYLMNLHSLDPNQWQPEENHRNCLQKSSSIFVLIRTQLYQHDQGGSILDVLKQPLVNI